MDCSAGTDNTVGRCFDPIVSQCSAATVARHCPGSGICCPTPGVVSRKSNLASIYNINIQDMCFPLVQGDFTEGDGKTTGFITASSFSQNRATTQEGHARRCHKGLDMFTGVHPSHMTHGRVIAIAPGTVTSVMDGFTACNDGWYYDSTGAGKKVPANTLVYGVTVHHPSLNVDVTYGELTFSYVTVGDSLVKAQLLGEATACTMLHFELWTPNQRVQKWWGPADETDISLCCPNDDSVPQNAHGLLNPRPLLRMLQGKWCDPVEPSGQTIKKPSHAH